MFTVKTIEWSIPRAVLERSEHPPSPPELGQEIEITIQGETRKYIAGRAEWRYTPIHNDKIFTIHLEPTTLGSDTG